VISVLVPFREPGDGHRTKLWDLIAASLHKSFAEVLVGTDDGLPFNKGKAVNAAASRASGGVYLITDADTWVSPELVGKALDAITVGAAWSKPWNLKLKLDEQTTRDILAQGPAWDGTLTPRQRKGLENLNTFVAAPPLLVTREAFDGVGGMDERIAGWGQDDVTFARALRVLYGAPVMMRGTCIHLWHPRIGRSGRDLWDGQTSDAENRAIAAAYLRARRPEQMRELIASR